MTAYEMAVSNIARYIKEGLPKDSLVDKRHRHPKKVPVAFDAFEASSVLAVAFCKSKDETLSDIMNAQITIEE